MWSLIMGLIKFPDYPSPTLLHILFRHPVEIDIVQLKMAEMLT